MPTGFWSPARTFELRSRYTAPEALARLAAQVKLPMNTLSAEAMDSDSYYGTITDNHFMVERGLPLYIGLGPVFFPVTTGTVTPSPSGSAVKASVRLQSVMESLLAAVVVLALAAGIFVSLFAGLLMGAGVIAIVFAVLWYGYRFHFSLEADHTKDFLCDTLGADEA